MTDDQIAEAQRESKEAWKSSQPTTNAEIKSDDHPAGDFSALELVMLYADKKAAPYEGKTIIVRGKVGEQGQLGYNPCTTLDVTQDGILYAGVICFLDDGKPQFEHLARGDSAQYAGVLKGIVGAAVVMEQCYAVPPSR
jgi:hypothetical protein